MTALKSMTAFGRAETHTHIGSLTAEIQSLNRKFLDISISLPKELTAFEIEARIWIASRMQRGKITLRVSAQFETDTPIEVAPNLPLVRQIKQALDRISEEFQPGNSPGKNHFSSVDLNALIQLPDVLQYQISSTHEAAWLPLLKKTVEEALERADEMRIKEGKAIFEEFMMRTKMLSLWVQEIQALAPFVKEKYRDKLKQTIEPYFSAESIGDQEERLVREVCLYAERVDISEEISRFQFHLEQFIHTLQTKAGPQGKTLEFILQELGREVNTIGSKAQDVQISKKVVDIKNELERIREQVQNVE